MNSNLKLGDDVNNKRKAVSMNDIICMIDQLLEDKSVPKNVRARMEEIKSSLADETQEKGIRIGTSISIMDDISNDPNLPTYARTQLWNIVSLMESVRSNLR